LGSRKSNPASGLAALIILCLTSLVLFTIYVKEGDSGPLHTVQLGAAEVLRPVRGLFGLAASPFSAVSERVQGVIDLSEKKELEEKALEYEEGAAEAARLRQENERLRQLLNGQQRSFTYSPLAQVVAPVGGQLTERVVINVGTNDGIKPEQPVIVGDNILIGRTTNRVTPNTAEVLLITDQNFAAGVRILPPKATEEESTSGKKPDLAANSHGEGLLRTSWEGYLGVDYVDLSAKAEQGDFVVTSGRAGDRELLFPPGLLVGTVESVSSQDIDQYKKIVAAPIVKADDLQEVRVIVDW
jgi:rod shape-determining protein MreC